MKGLYTGIVTGCDKWKDKQTEEMKAKTYVSLGGRDILEVNGNGFAEGASVFVSGDVRRRQDGGLYVLDAKIIARRPDVTLEQVTAQLERQMAAPQGAAPALQGQGR